MQLKIMIIIRVILQFLFLIYDRFSVLVRCLRLDAIHYLDRLYDLVDIFLRLRPRIRQPFAAYRGYDKKKWKNQS